MVISGPAGSGKTTLCERMLAVHAPQVQRAITATTRLPRGQEKDGVDYYFFDEKTFLKKVATDEFLEYAHVHNRYYGTLKSEVFSKLEKNIDILLNIDVQGAAILREKAKNDAYLAKVMRSIFILPPSMSELEQRIVGRGTDSYEEITRRMKVAVKEMEEACFYDYQINSASRDEDFAELEKIYYAEKSKSYL